MTGRVPRGLDAIQYSPQKSDNNVVNLTFLLRNVIPSALFADHPEL